MGRATCSTFRAHEHPLKGSLQLLALHNVLSELKELFNNQTFCYTVTNYIPVNNHYAFRIEVLVTYGSGI